MEYLFTRWTLQAGGLEPKRFQHPHCCVDHAIARGFLDMVNIVALAKVLGTTYAVASELTRTLKYMQKRSNRSRYRKVRKGRKK